MSLRTLLPALPDDVHSALSAADINSVHDILAVNTSQLYTRLPRGLFSLRELSGLKSQVARLISAPATRGDDLFTYENARKKARDFCGCGIDELDALLGGFGHPTVIEIAGGRCSGKTGLALQVILRHLACQPKNAVFWLDIGGEFVVERAVEILQRNPGIGTETALDRLSVTTCFDVAEAHQALDDLRVLLARETETLRTRFIVIDPLTPLFAPILSATSSQGHAVMTTFMRLLASLTRTFAITALVLNAHVQAQGHNPYSAFQSTTIKPALGPTFTFLTDETLWLSSVDATQSPGAEGHVFVAEVFRSHSTFSKMWCAFVLRNGVSFEPFVMHPREEIPFGAPSD